MTGVSCMKKKEKKIPATAAIQQQKNNVDDDDKKNQNNFSRRKFFSILWLYDVLRVTLTVCIWRKFFLSHSLAMYVVWMSLYMLENEIKRKKSWENKNTRESGKKVKKKDWKKLNTNIFFYSWGKYLSVSDVSVVKKQWVIWLTIILFLGFEPIIFEVFSQF